MKLTALTLCVIMFLLPAVSVAGDYGCRTVSHASCNTYSAPVYSNQSYVGYQQSYNTVYPYAIPVAILPSTFYQVAPELAQARIQAEVVSAAVKEALKAQGDMFERLSRGPAYVQQVPYMPPGVNPSYVQPGTIPPAASYEPPPGYKLVPIDQERTAPQPTPQIQPPKEKEPPPVPPASSKDVPMGKDGKAITALGAVQKMANDNCVKCHGGGNSHVNLTDVGKLARPQLLEMEHRIMSLDPKVVMPPPGDGRKPVPEELLGAVHVRINEVGSKQP